VVATEAGTPQPLPPELDLVAHRVTQEMLTNAIKHGRADRPVIVERHWPQDAWERDLRIEVRNATPPTVEDPDPDPDPYPYWSGEPRARRVIPQAYAELGPWADATRRWIWSDGVTDNTTTHRPGENGGPGWDRREYRRSHDTCSTRT
jgi:hypothetical protein